MIAYFQLQKLNVSLFCVEPGRLMTKYYLKFDTMKYIINAPTGYSLDEALHIVCRAEEISCMSNLLWYIPLFK